MSGVATGRVIRFNVMKGFGFIAPDAGGADVFLHASSFQGDPALLVPGVAVEFDPLEGTGGVKAVTARIINRTRQSGGFTETFSDRALGGVAPDLAQPADDSDTCDVVPASELERVVTDVLLNAAPTLTGAQIVDVRERLVRYARARGWLDG